MSLVNRHFLRAKLYFLIYSIMPFHLSNSLSTKYSSIKNQKLHEYEYKKFLKTLQINNQNSRNLSEEKFFKHQKIYFNNNYLFQRQINLQYRQNQRKYEYESIQKENFKFSQRLMNAKTFFNHYEQKIFFDKHCKLKQRLQHYPDLIRNQTKKLDYQFSSNNHVKVINQPVDSSVLIYNDNVIPRQEKYSKKTSKDLSSNINKSHIAQKNLPRFIKHNSQISKTLPPIQNTK